MITDNSLLLEAGGALSNAITATRVTENVIDLSVARDIGEGEALYMVYTVLVDGTGAGNVTFQAIVSDTDTMGTPTVLAQSEAYVGTALDAVSASKPNGTVIVLQIPPTIASLGKRYLSGRFVVAPTVGAVKCNCTIVKDIQDGLKFYPRSDNP